MGKVRNEHGSWYPLEANQKINGPKTDIFKFLVENAESPLVKRALADIEQREFYKLIMRKPHPTKEQLEEEMSMLRVKAIKIFMKELGYE
jgi:hypothetical protein